MPKKLYGPCSVKNCEFEVTTFRNFTDLGYKKSMNDGTFHQYNYLKVGDQICLPHYLSIVSSDRISRYRNKKPTTDPNEKNYDKNDELKSKNDEENKLGKPIENRNILFLYSNLILLTQNILVINEENRFGEKINLLTKTLYNLQRKQDKSIELNPLRFDNMITEEEPQLKGFFKEMCDSLIPKTRSPYNQNESKESVVGLCYQIAGMKNKFINEYKLYIGLYLAAKGTCWEAIDTMASIGISVCAKTIENYRKKIVNEHHINIRKYFQEKVMIISK